LIKGQLQAINNFINIPVRLQKQNVVGKLDRFTVIWDMIQDIFNI